jgi:hypothetical protein
MSLFATRFHTGFFLGLFYPEDEGDIFLRNFVEFERTTLRYIPEDITLHSDRCENLNKAMCLNSRVLTWT